MPLIFRPLGTLLLSGTLGLALTACGGSEASGPEVPAGFTVGYGVKTYSFGWNASAKDSLHESPSDVIARRAEAQTIVA